LQTNHAAGLATCSAPTNVLICLPSAINFQAHVGFALAATTTSTIACKFRYASGHGIPVRFNLKG
jgi:hypothetical protein